MYLKLYADSPVRRTRQLLADAFAVFWAWLWITLAIELYRLISKLAVVGQKLESTGHSLDHEMTSAQQSVNGVPLVGHKVSSPFGKIAGTGRSLVDVGQAQVHAVHDLAVFAAVCLAVLPIAVLVVVWLPRRVRFVRRATASRRLIDTAADLDLFALRALASQPVHVLARIAPDPADSWRRKDPLVLTALARLELGDAGVRVK